MSAAQIPESGDADDRPRSMRDEGAQLRRRTMLTLAHVDRLTAYAAKLRSHGSVEVPEFDPLDGGVDALVLFLFEKPGPKTADGTGFSGRVGSGFISRNNDDPTAMATLDFMQKACIPRKLTILWNVIPWWNGTRKVTQPELNDGVGCVKELILMLPKLVAVVMVGRKAARAKPYLESTGLKLFTSAHPSPLLKARFPERWNAIPSEWAKVSSFILETPET